MPQSDRPGGGARVQSDPEQLGSDIVQDEVIVDGLGRRQGLATVILKAHLS